MNLFPNMKIYINTHEESHPVSQPRVRTSISRTASSALSGIIQNVLRRASDGGGTTGGVNEGEDIQFYFGFETPNTAESEPSVIRVLSRTTELFVYQAQETQSSTELCSICRNGLVHGEICRRVRACGHFFHHACIDSWLDRNQTCPVCRNALVAENQE
jgi:hypothetical protein